MRRTGSTRLSAFSQGSPFLESSMASRLAPHVLHGLADGRQLRFHQPSGEDSVESGDDDVVGNPDTGLLEESDHAEGGLVRAADQGLRQSAGSYRLAQTHHVFIGRGEGVIQQRVAGIETTFLEAFPEGDVTGDDVVRIEPPTNAISST